MSLQLKRIIEALIFVAEAPLSRAQLAQVLETYSPDEIQKALDELKQEYHDGAQAFILAEVAGGYCFRTRVEYAFWLRKLKREQATRLSRAALETLAIIAYKQPIMKAEVEQLRGVEVGGVLRMLMEKDLVRAVGRQDLPGRPLIYGTTKKFLEVFDLNDLRDLPTLEELKSLAMSDGDTLPEGLEGEEIEVLDALPPDLDQSSEELLIKAIARDQVLDIVDNILDNDGTGPAAKDKGSAPND